MKLSIYIPIALAVAAAVFWIVPLKPEAVFYPIPKGGVSIVPDGLQRLGVYTPWIMECDVCKQPATQADSRLEPGTKLRSGDRVRLACDQHAFIPMRERYSDKFNGTYAVLMALTFIPLMFFLHKRGSKLLAASEKPGPPTP